MRELYFVSGKSVPGESIGNNRLSGTCLAGCIHVCESRLDALLVGVLTGDVCVVCPGSCRAFRLSEGTVLDGMLSGRFIATEIPFGEFLRSCGPKVICAGNYPVAVRGDDGSFATFSLGGHVELRVYPDGHWDRACPAEGWVVTRGDSLGVNESCEIHGDISVACGDMCTEVHGRKK